MGDLNGGFSSINSGYANDGNGNMKHFKAQGDAGLAALTEESLRKVDYTVNGKTMKDYFFDLHDLSEIVEETSDKWVVSGSTYTYTIEDLSNFDENGDYNDIVLKAFQYFAAPMLLMHKKTDTSHYFSPSSIEIEKTGGYLAIRLYAASDTGKLISSGGLLSCARVYKGLILPGYYIAGDYTNWEVLPGNRLGNGDDGNYAVTEGFKIRESGKIKAIHVLDNGYTEFHGSDGTASGGDINLAHNGIYNFYVSKTTNVLYVNFVQPLVFNAYWDPTDTKNSYGRIFVYLYDDTDSSNIKKNANWPGMEITSYDHDGWMYSIDAEGYKNVIFTCYENDGTTVVKENGSIPLSSINDGGVTVHSGSDWIWVGIWPC